jgi:polyisoprenyl-teichoic acid--peptidoglycan teichoic acid transferase
VKNLQKKNKKIKEDKNIKSKKKNLVLKFISIVSILVGSFIVLASIIIFGFVGARIVRVTPDADSGVIAQIIPEFQIIIPPIHSTFLIMGTDNQNIADAIMIVTLNTEQERIDLVSIPRDTLVTLDDQTMASLRADGRNAPRSMTLGELNSIAGVQHSPRYMMQEVERMLNITIDYYAQVSLRAFRELVDIVGGVYMEIRPQGMFYNDGAGFIINIQGGMQHLDGARAEQVVRFRNYPDGDIGRIRVQQEFLGLLLNQTLAKENIMSNLPDLIALFIDTVNTNFTILDSGRYLPFAPFIMDYAFYTHIVPHSIVGSRVAVDEIEARQLMKDIVEGVAEQEDLHKVPQMFSSKLSNIQVLNGGNVTGYASLVESQMIENGYNIVGIGNYEGPPRVQTRIITNDITKGFDLIPYFDNAFVILDTTLQGDYDIIIIIGVSDRKFH